MTFDHLWQEITTDSMAAGSIMRRVHPELSHDVFLGESRPGGQRFLALALHGPVGEVPQLKRLSRGVDVKVILETATRAAVQLTETTQSHSSLFQELVDDVVALLVAEPGDGAAARIVERVMAWQSFFATSRAGLSAEQEAGLFAELYILRRTLIPDMGAPAAIRAWAGPHGAHQDFHTASGALEVKSFRGIGPGHMRITSERQLEEIGAGALFLAYVELDERTDGTGESISQAVGATRQDVSGSVAASIDLQDKLLQVGYHESQADRYTDKFSVRGMTYYRVEGAFPRLTSAHLPTGIGKVSYQLDQAAILDWETTSDAVFKVIEGE